MEIDAPGLDVLRGLRIIQAQINPYSERGRYTVDLYDVRKSAQFYSDLCAAFDWLSRICWIFDSNIIKNLPESTRAESMRRLKKKSKDDERGEKMRKLWADPEYRARMSRALKDAWKRRKKGRPL